MGPLADILGISQWFDNVRFSGAITRYTWYITAVRQCSLTWGLQPLYLVYHSGSTKFAYQGPLADIPGISQRFDTVRLPWAFISQRFDNVRLPGAITRYTWYIAAVRQCSLTWGL